MVIVKLTSARLCCFFLQIPDFSDDCSNKVVTIVRERNEIVTYLEASRIRENEDSDAFQDLQMEPSRCEERRKKMIKTPKKNRILSWVTRKNE